VTEEKFVFEQEFIYEKNDKNWSLTLKRSDVATQDLRELLLLDLHHPLFLEQETKADHDSVYFTYQIEPLGLSKEEIEKRTISERIRLALNVFALEAALELPVICCILAIYLLPRMRRLRLLIAGFPAS